MTSNNAGQTLTQQQIDEIEARAARLYERTATIDPNAHPDFGQLTDADVPALLAEVRRLRGELAEYEVLNPQQCPKGVHADWLVDSEYAHACPWCENERLRARVTELEGPAVEAKRREIRGSFTELIAQAQQDRDYEGAFGVQCLLREREEQWAREDAEAPAVSGAADSRQP